MKKVYCLVEDNNILNYIGIKHYDFPDIVLLYSDQCAHAFDLEAFKRFLCRQGCNHIAVHHLDLYNIESIKNAFRDADSKDVILLPGHRKAYALNFYEVAREKNVNRIFIEEDGDIFVQNGQCFEELSGDHVNLSVKEYIQNLGGAIRHSTGELFSSEAGQDILACALKNIRAFQSIVKIKKPLRTVMDEFTQHHRKDLPVYVDVDLYRLDSHEEKLLREILNIMHQHKIITRPERSRKFRIAFLDREYKEYLFKAGTWFEHMTYNVIKSVKGVDDVQSSVTFLWSLEHHDVKNEMDILAVHDNRLIAVSCKDTSKHTEDHLNELVMHSNNLGFDDSIKILATTRHPQPLIMDRAKELGIHVAVYGGNQTEFIRQINQAVLG